jgi:hypothetical protein
MYVAVYLPFFFAALFGLAAGPLAARLPPAIATWLLSVGGLLTSVGTTASLALLGFTLIGQSALLADRGPWSNTSLHQQDPVATPIAVIALVVLVVLAVHTVRATTRRMTALRETYRMAAALPTAGGELAVLHSDDRYAVALPGRPGRIAITTAMLRTLDAAQRRAVLAHERSHLTHHHHAHQTLTQVAAAANPLLHRLPTAITLSCERWADEDAALACRRDTVASALIRAATTTRSNSPVVALAAAATHVAARVAALRAPSPRHSLWRAGLLIALLLATTAALAEATHDTERLFERAIYAYQAGQR